MEYPNYVINSLKNWWYPPQIKKDALQILRQKLHQQQEQYKLAHNNIVAQVMQSQNSSKINSDVKQKCQFYYKTKHTSPDILIQRICMMYANLVTQNNKQFQNFVPINADISALLPYNSHLNESNFNKLKNCVGLRGELKLNKQKIKCTLIVQIFFHDDIEYSTPYVYILNPDSKKMQINPNFRNLYYQQTIGGVKVLIDQLRTKANIKQHQYQKLLLKLNWSQYKQENLYYYASIMSEIVQTHFPYVKRYTPWQVQQSVIDSQYFMKMPKQLQCLLSTIQNLQIIKKSIDSQISYLGQQTHKLKSQLQQQQALQSIDKMTIHTDKFMSITDGQDILNIVAQINAYNDCLVVIQKKLGNKQCLYEQCIDCYRQICSSIFERKFYLNKLMKHKEQHYE